MGKLLSQAASPEILNRAWKKVRNDLAPWQAGISRKEMEKNLAFHLLRLSEELANGRYRPDPVRIFPVNKGDGGQRIITALTLRDKVAQRAILTVLEPIGETYFHHNSFGYRQGRSIEMAISKVREYMLCGFDWVVDGDILSFFDNIPHKPLAKVLRSHIPDREIVGLIRKWLETGVVRRGFASTPKGIPQGAVISPFLCNLYLTAWDNEMAAKNLPSVRFADDFLVFSQSKMHAQEAMKQVERTLKRLKLTLHPQKTRVVKCGPSVRFLGKRLPKLKVQPVQKGRAGGKQ